MKNNFIKDFLQLISLGIAMFVTSRGLLSLAALCFVCIRLPRASHQFDEFVEYNFQYNLDIFMYKDPFRIYSI